jgi:cytochrome c553
VRAAALALAAAVCAAAAQSTAQPAAPQADTPAAPAPQSAAPAPAKGDAERAKKDKISMCTGCHGIDAYRTAYPVVYSVPMIAGQNEGYIVSALKEYRARERSHPTMRAIAASLSDQDIADLAAYYSNTKPN